MPLRQLPCRLRQGAARRSDRGTGGSDLLGPPGRQARLGELCARLRHPRLGGGKRQVLLVHFLAGDGPAGDNAFVARQIVGRLVYEKMLSPPDSLYGTRIASNYQGQGLKLSKHFRF